ncbi:MAG: LacI family DNA-binding transcriptional regulator [Lachnospiraceae bacterium]|nr:LacI family DNA-binding transcriptional regulator [Lachnospiraceae bacterium]
MITVKEIAKLCDVSPSTVSNILNGKNNMSQETKDKVLKCIEETGYRPNYYAQGMRRQNNKTICIIAEEICQFSSPAIVESIMNDCEAAGYRTVLINLGMYLKWDTLGLDVGSEALMNENTEPAFTEAEAIRADGVIYIAAHGRELDVVPKNFDIPVVFAYGLSKGNKYKSVVIDDELSSMKAIEHLMENGHKKIGIVSGRENNFHTVERLKGVKRAFDKHKIELPDDLVLYGNWERESGYECAKTLVDKGVTAIWCMNDIMAGGVYDYLYEKGLKVGDDISVMGFDNREISGYFYPKLSTMSIMLERIGSKVTDVMLREIEDPIYRERTIEPEKIVCEFVERDSVKKI